MKHPPIDDSQSALQLNITLTAALRPVQYTAEVDQHADN